VGEIAENDKWKKVEKPCKKPGAGQKLFLNCNGQDLTRHPLHQGIISRTKKDLGISPTKAPFL
jgi:hypothetical protein